MTLPGPDPGRRVPGHDPNADDTVRRVFSMVGRVCRNCPFSCGSEACPVYRARWFGDWSGEFVEHPVPAGTESPTSTADAEPQMNLF